MAASIYIRIDCIFAEKAIVTTHAIKGPNHCGLCRQVVLIYIEVY